MVLLCILVLAGMLSGCHSYLNPDYRTLGEVTDDSALRTKIKGLLLRDPELSSFRIDVAVHKGLVTLSGPAPTSTAVDRIRAQVAALKGVTGVRSELRVAGGGADTASARN